MSDHNGEAVTDEATVQRIRDLVIPPAWKKVWICPYPNGHIQAVGSDVAGRRQYLYHQQWQEERNEEKFDQVLEMSAELPDMRRHIVADLRRRGLERDRVLALALHLLDLGYFRSGSEQYTEENNSYGIATLLCEHVTVHKEAVEFDYPAKSGVRRTLQVEDPEVVRSVRALLRGRRNADRFLVCRNGSGWADLQRGRPQHAIQRTCRGRIHRQRPTHLARHGAGRRSLRRRGSPGEQDRDQTCAVRHDEGSRGGTRQESRRREVVIRRPARGRGLRGRTDHRRRREAGGAQKGTRRAAGDAGEQHRAADPQGGQGLAGRPRLRRRVASQASHSG
jgi:hypothetical protein